jgi:hypothetical protein
VGRGAGGRLRLRRRGRGTGLVDFARFVGASPFHAYALVFVIEAAAFVVAAEMARRLGSVAAAAQQAPEGALPAQS